MSQMAIGLASGAVIHIRGDLSKDRTIKQKVIYEGEEPITGMWMWCLDRELHIDSCYIRSWISWADKVNDSFHCDNQQHHVIQYHSQQTYSGM